jgi:L-seryl-tRNA(Ser) seleniumtransferase
MIAMPAAELDRRARSWAERIGTGEVMDSHSTVGGGSLPEETLPTRVLALSVPRPQDFLARMRDTTPPVIARVEKNRVLLDPRTVMESEDEDLLRILKQVLAQIGSDRKNPPG